MGLSISEPPQTIVLVQWKNKHHGSPHLQFWTLERSIDARAQTLPIPVAISGRTDGIDRTNPSRPEAHLPPLLSYCGGSESILIHDLTIADSINIELTQWGPGIRFTQMLAMDSLFHCESLRRISGMNSTAAVISGLGKPQIDHHATSMLLTAIAMDNERGTVDIKYRAAELGRDSFLPFDTKESYSNHEQTLRAITPEAATRPHPMSVLSTQFCSVGRRMSYLVLMTLARDKETEERVLSLYTIPERLLFSEACSMSQPNEDRGLRWQVQTFELPREVTNIAPIVVGLDRTSYLLVFYFHQGVLHYSAMQYAGSGSFVNLVQNALCLAAESQVSSSTPQGPESSSRPRFPLSSRLSIFPQGHLFSPKMEDGGKESGHPALPQGATGCQPYAVRANGWVWVFYQGADMNGVYVRRRIKGLISDIDKGWESVTWTAGASREATGEDSGEPQKVAGTSAHFIPVAVSGSFMSMY